MRVSAAIWRATGASLIFPKIFVAINSLEMVLKTFQKPSEVRTIKLLVI